MKKILICSAFPTSSTGGAELYGKKIIDTFKSQYDFTELCMYLDEKNSEEVFYIFKNIEEAKQTYKKNIFYKLVNIFTFYKLDEFVYRFFLRKRWNKKIKKIDKENNFYKIIFNVNVFSSYKKIAKKSISIQHNDANWLVNNLIMYSKFANIICSIFKIKSHFLNSQTIVCFTEGDVEVFKKVLPNKNYFNVIFQMNIKSLPSTKSCYEKNISYFGRFDEKQKLSSKLMDLFENNKMKLNFISDNVPNEIKTKYKFINFISPKNHDDAILKFKQYASALILISEYEGLPIVCLEALNLNIPLILRDSFETAKFLINGGKNGFLLPKEYDEQKYAKLIKELSINKIKKNDLEEFNKLISEKNFIKKWNNILNIK